MWRSIAAFGLTVACLSSAAAQPPADAASVEAIVSALYATISGPAGERDWGRFRGLFAEGARLIPTARPESGPWVPRVLTVDGYIQRTQGYFAQTPFYEREAARVVERYGAIAHVFSTYESRTAPDADPFVRGINSIQLFFDGTRWWVVSVLWDDERGAGSITDRYRSTDRSR